MNHRKVVEDVIEMLGLLNTHHVVSHGQKITSKAFADIAKYLAEKG